MKLEQALELDFESYLLWCHEWCQKKCASDPIFYDVYHATEFKIIEAGWARRYWFYKCNNISDYVKG